jgi:hypothetical protein
MEIIPYSKGCGLTYCILTESLGKGNILRENFLLIAVNLLKKPQSPPLKKPLAPGSDK